jgi:hypothetical protein
VALGSLRSVLYSQRVSSVPLRALVKRLRRIGGVSVGVDDPQLGVSFGQSFVDEVNFADQLRSELNPFGEEARYAIAAGFQFVVVV